MLTPIDIEKQDFDVSFRGYNADEVDDFLDMVATDYKKLYLENSELRTKVAELQTAVDDYKKKGDSVQNALILANEAIEQMKQKASQQADSVVNDAQNKATDMIRQSNEDILQKKKELADLQLEVDGYRAQMQGICSRVMELLDKMK
ncbi:MAG: DivIVA domain-containing protein [Ruminococcaceae bacterium]|nr:DivIVA domain-containing protein [Oscillospiraceae bacterium]